MDKVEELIGKLESAAREHERDIHTGTAWNAIESSKGVIEARIALTKALTVSPEKLEACARAIFRTGFAPHEEQAIIDEKWAEWPTDRKAAFARARAAAIALGLRCEE